MKAGRLVLTGVTRLPRPDVRRTFPIVVSDETGFEIRGTLPTGRLSIDFEAQLEDGTWHHLDTRAIEIPRQYRPLWLGGGKGQDLMFFQMSAHPAYPPRPIQTESFPAPSSTRTQPKLAIVTPSYNQARFLSETMRSVLEQRGVDCDYVVQDGGSTDGSKQLIAAMETGDCRPETGTDHNQGSPSSLPPPASGLQNSPRLLHWSSGPDAGQADAIAKGFARTLGGPDDLMAWINSDDFYLPGTLGFVADFFAKHPAVDVIYGHRILVDENSREIGRWFLPRHDHAVLRLNDFVPQETMFWRRRVWEKVGGIDTSFKFALDWDLLLRFQAAGAKIVRVPYFLACFRIHSAQKTSAQMQMTGQSEIDRLRARTFGRVIPPAEIENSPTLLRYLRRSAFIEFLWKLRIRAP